MGKSRGQTDHGEDQCPGGRRENVVYCGHSSLSRAAWTPPAGCSRVWPREPARPGHGVTAYSERLGGAVLSLGSTAPRMVSGHREDPGTPA